MLEAKTKLSQLVDAVEHGEEVTIARNGVAVVQLVPIRKTAFNLGFLKNKVEPISDNLLFGMTDEEADQFIGGTE